MKKLNILILLIMTMVLNNCSIFGDSGVEIAPYKVLKKEDHFDIRYYDELILVTTNMTKEGERNSAFKELFNYISGENTKSQKISMTAPVFLDPQQNEIQTMSFVLPVDISYKNAPKPQNSNLKLHKITNYTVATITFNGRLSENNIQKHRVLLEDWIKNNKFEINGPVKVAGYNPPFTIPSFRRNEILIPIKKPNR